MSRIKMAAALIFFGIIGFLCALIINVDATPKEKISSSLLVKNRAIIAQNNFIFQTLPYSYDALEPFIDKQTMEVHYSKHYKAYYDNFINAIKGTELATMEFNNIFKNISKYPVAVRNNSGGYFNHIFYWNNMKANGGGLPTGKIFDAIVKTYGSLDEFKKQFTSAGLNRFGSGWVWLCVDTKGNLFVCSTPNQDNPLMDIAEKNGIPLLTMDVWEHAYYLKYQSKRADYIDAFWCVVSWEVVAARYDQALKSIVKE